MSRRDFLAGVGLTAAAAGGIWYFDIDFDLQNAESQLEQSGELGETKTIGNLEITAEDAFQVSTITIGQADDKSELESPSDAIYSFVKISIDNTDIESTEGPALNFSNYDTMKEKEDVIYTKGVNDIQICSESDCGAPIEYGISDLVGATIFHDGAKLQTYGPHLVDGPKIGPDENVSGWVFALNRDGEDIRLKIQMGDTKRIWNIRELSEPPSPTPTPTPDDNISI